MLQTTREKCEELGELAKSAEQLKVAFMDMECLVDAQGDVIDEIGRHVAAGRAETERAAEQLRRADSSQRWHCGCRAIVIGVLLLVIALLLLLGRTERLFLRSTLQ